MPKTQCPTCGQEVTYHEKKEVPFRPFCSKRCKLIDLGKWLNEEYTISENIDPLEEEFQPGENGDRYPEDD
jgi:hypothetical protein